MQILGLPPPPIEVFTVVSGFSWGTAPTDTSPGQARQERRGRWEEEPSRDAPGTCRGQHGAAVPGGRKSRRALSASLCLSLKPRIAGNTLRLTCQPMTTKSPTSPSPGPAPSPCRARGHVKIGCFLETSSQHWGR